MKNVMCVKWGTLYGPEYVNILYAMCRRNITGPFNFICITDNGTGIRDEVTILPLTDTSLKGWWSKLAFFQKHPTVEGPCLTFDLDMVIVDNIDCFFDYEPEKFCMKWDYTTGKKINHGHSSCVMRFEANRYMHIHDAFDINRYDCGIHNTERGFKRHHYWGDQLWITECVGEPVSLWPKDWIVKFSRDCHRDPKTKEPIGERSVNKIGLHTQEFFVPDRAKVIAFSGKHLRNENELDKIGTWWNDA